ncbi:uncharacterized protein LOC122502394 [Leptopilina heterotoma]|uniref:uncharacterized protein LOC122502394 n=1 Tax=Leptopilina heterotoma TaxID=63436 RepID=UPI001CA9053F|nr:uncharacterized protein LOC122502394 [Leptopilina heterotoma]
MRKEGYTLKKEITLVAILAVQKFPGLKGTYGQPHERMEKRLINCLKNKKREDNKRMNKSKIQNVSKKRKINEIAETSMKDSSFHTLLQEEWRKLDRDRGRIKELLTESREQRKLDAQKLSASEMLSKYPALHDKDLFLWEFEKIVDVPMKIMRRNLLHAVPKLCALIETKPENEEKNNLIHLLQNLPEFFKTKGKNDTSFNILEMNVNETVPPKDRPPFLIAADIEGLQLKCYVDSEPMHCSDSLEATILLIASYYIFNIGYNKHLKFQFSLLENIIFGRHVSRLIPAQWRFLTVTNILERAGIL